MTLEALTKTTYESSPWRRGLAGAAWTLKYAVARPILSRIAWLSRRADEERGASLRPGITYCLVARNERDTVKACLDSLLGLADEIVAFDNGSDDGTLERMQEFARENETRARTRVLSRPGANLRELRQESANLVETTWFVRGDADMIFLNHLRNLKPKLLARERPGAVLCRKVNTYGDHLHFNRLFGAVSPGEYFLRSYDAEVRYVEYGGRLEHAPIPLHYELLQPEGLAMLHLDSRKPNERLFFRTCYLDWRELVNKRAADQPASPTLQEYQRAWLRHNFGTEEALGIRFRMARLVAAQCAPLPDDLAALVNQTPGAASDRFAVEYLDGKPWLRVDREDRELGGYKPSLEDLSWAPDPDRFYRDSLRTKVWSER